MCYRAKTAVGDIVKPYAELELQESYVRSITQRALVLQGALPDWLDRNPERAAAMLAGTRNVLAALTDLGWLLVPPGLDGKSRR